MDMDRQVKTFLDYSKIIDKEIENDIRDEIKKRIADSIFVAYGARNVTPIEIEKKTLLPSSGQLNSTIFFSNEKASVDVASFINGSMVRYLDYSDTYLSKEALHPSDNIPPLIALGESLGRTGEDLIRAIALSYSVVCSLADASSIRDRGWDHVTYVSISSAAGLAKLMDLDDDKFENAINLALNNNISMRQTRAGELSMWKGCTASNASRNSVVAVLLASNGFTGPSPIFEGEMGFFKQVSGEFKAVPSAGLILKTMIKNFPVEYHAMSATEAALDLRNELSGEIESVEVNTFSVANTIIVKDPEKWRPETKETADHSLPYIVAYTLNFGAPGLQSYDRRFLEDARIRDTMGKMKISVLEKYDDLYPEYLPANVSVKTDAGSYEKEILAPKGHHKNPYTWDDLLHKGEKIMGENSSKEIVEFSKSIEKRDVGELLEVMSNVHS